MTKRLIPIFLLTIFSASASYSSALEAEVVPDEVGDISFLKYYDSKLQMSGIEVMISASYQSDQYSSLTASISRDVLQSVIKNSWKEMSQYLSGRGVRIRDCRGERYNVNFFFVTKNEMNRPGRWDRFFEANPENNRTPIYGYYDATHDIPYNSAIIIREMPSSELTITIAHEMAHYWWDRLCLSRSISQTPEGFAQSFEREYARSLR
jgi:hypothetical protein